MPVSLEHFSGASLPSGWTAITAAGGTVTVSDSCVHFTLSGSSDAAAIYKPFDPTRSQIVLVCMRGNQAGGTPNPTLQVVHNTGTPTTDLNANILQLFRPQIYTTNQSIRMSYTDVGGTNYNWQDSSNSWQTGNTIVSMLASTPQDDFRIMGFQWDAENARMRMVALHVATGSAENADYGPRLTGLTDWVALADMRNGTSSTLWLILGWPQTDKFTSAGSLQVEWISESWGPQLHVQANGKASVGSAYNITAHVGHDLRAMFLPTIRGAIAIPAGSPGAFDDVDTQWGGLFIDDDGVYVAPYLGDAGSAVVTIGMVTATDPNGSWTKQGQIINVGPGGSTYEARFGSSLIIKDWTELDPAKRYKCLAKGYDAGGAGRVLLFTAPTRTGTYTYQGVFLEDDATETQVAYRGQPVFYKGRWWLFYNCDVAGQDVVRAAWCKRLAVGAVVRLGQTLHVAGQNAVEQAITAVSGRTITVASTTGMVQDMLVVITNSTSADTYGLSRIRKVISSTQAELYYSVPGMTTSSVLRSANFGIDNALQQVVKSDDTWHYIATLFKTFTSHATLKAHFESNGLLQGGATPFVTPTVVWPSTPIVPLGRDSWNTTVSNENLRLARPTQKPVDPRPVRLRQRSSLIRR